MNLQPIRVAHTEPDSDGRPPELNPNPQETTDDR